MLKRTKVIAIRSKDLGDLEYQLNVSVSDSIVTSDRIGGDMLQDIITAFLDCDLPRSILEYDVQGNPEQGGVILNNVYTINVKDSMQDFNNNVQNIRLSSLLKHLRI